MRCPICKDIELKMAERQGVEIDYCPQCRGVWLDRGELDKIIEKSYSPMQTSRYRGEDDRYTEGKIPHGYRDSDDHDDHHGYGSSKHHKRKSLLKELFDF